MEKRRYTIHNFQYKHNRNKIKTTYHEVQYFWTSWRTGLPEERFTIQNIGYHRQIKTTNERRQNLAHVDEHGIQMVRGKRRGRNLPDAWEDRSSQVWKTKASWKHNSKRPTQYKL